MTITLNTSQLIIHLYSHTDRLFIIL